MYQVMVRLHILDYVSIISHGENQLLHSYEYLMNF